jgi:hypothetical protein
MTTPSLEFDTTTLYDESRVKLAMTRINGKYRNRRFKLRKEWCKDTVTPCTAVQSERQEALLDNMIAQIDEKAAFLTSLKKGLFRYKHSADCRIPR